MVSLYRAWAAWRGMSVPGAPDALVQVGGVRFAAHARLLVAHSGYFKSVLSRHWNPTVFPSIPATDDFRSPDESKAAAEAEGYEAGYERRDFETTYGEARTGDLSQIVSEENIIYLPNISAQQFWPLLAYMYTGYLELTPENIYQVLLATHLLHMPRALELCRNFLAQGATAPLPSLPTTVIKPIPSRKFPPYLPTTSYRPLYSEPPIPFLGSRYDAPFKPVEPLVLPERQFEEDKPDKDKSPNRRQDSPSKEIPLIIPTQVPINVIQTIEKTKPRVETSTVDNQRHEASVNSNRENELGAINLIKSKKPKPSAKKSKQPTSGPTKPTSETCVVLKEKTNTKIVSNDEKVIIDVACCDGPVRFHRVLNSAYKANGLETVRATADSSDSDDSYVEIEEDSRSRSDTPYDNCNAFSKSLQKQMSENIRSMNAKQNENNPAQQFLGEDDTPKVDAPDPDGSNSDISSKCQQETIYTCVYCNHTFKSQYCYQKHARRHINPVTIDAVNQLTAESGDGCCKARGVSADVKVNVAGPRREVRLLDMNVQYYPCKTCGSKFPSYYFVHKHRKLCHADELDGGVAEHAKSGVSTEKRKKLSTSGTDGVKEGAAVAADGAGGDLDNRSQTERAN